VIKFAPILEIMHRLLWLRILFLVGWLVSGATAPQWAMASSFTRFLDHTQRRTTVRRTPLDEWSDCSRDLYQTKHNTHNRQTSMQPVGFEPTISAGERPQTCALDRAATGTGKKILSLILKNIKVVNVHLRGTAVAQWLKRCTTNRKVAGSIPDWNFSLT